VAIGPERKNKIMTEADKAVTAYHEAGHALVGHVLPDSDPVHKVTIIPRGGTGGVTWFLPPEDRRFTPPSSNSRMSWPVPSAAVSPRKSSSAGPHHDRRWQRPAEGR
jgi:hypothetical protein